MLHSPLPWAFEFILGEAVVTLVFVETPPTMHTHEYERHAKSVTGVPPWMWLLPPTSLVWTGSDEVLFLSMFNWHNSHPPTHSEQPSHLPDHVHFVSHACLFPEHHDLHTAVWQLHRSFSVYYYRIAKVNSTEFCTDLQRSNSSLGRRWWRLSLSKLHLQCINRSTNAMPNQSWMCHHGCGCWHQQVWCEQARMKCSSCKCSNDPIVTHQDIWSNRHISRTMCILFSMLVCDERTTIHKLWSSHNRCVIPH